MAKTRRFESLHEEYMSVANDNRFVEIKGKDSVVRSKQRAAREIATEVSDFANETGLDTKHCRSILGAKYSGPR
jgi:hypothetical protein